MIKKVENLYMYIYITYIYTYTYTNTEGVKNVHVLRKENY